MVAIINKFHQLWLVIFFMFIMERWSYYFSSFHSRVFAGSSNFLILFGKHTRANKFQIELGVVYYTKDIWQTGQRIAAQTFPPSNPPFPLLPSQLLSTGYALWSSQGQQKGYVFPKHVFTCAILARILLRESIVDLNAKIKIWRTEVGIFTGNCSSFNHYQNCGHLAAIRKLR